MNRNKKCVLVNGYSSTGKTYSLKNPIQNHGSEVAYVDTDGKAMKYIGDNSLIAQDIEPVKTYLYPNTEKYTWAASPSTPRTPSRSSGSRSRLNAAVNRSTPSCTACGSASFSP